MQDGGLARLLGEPQVPAQVLELVGDRAEDTIEIEARLAHGQDASLGRPGHDPRPAPGIDLRSVMRMDADGDVQPLEPFAERERALTRGDVPAGDEDPLHAGVTSGAEDGSNVVLEPICVDVAMAVDQTHKNMVAAVCSPRQDTACCPRIISFPFASMSQVATIGNTWLTAGPPGGRLTTELTPRD